MSTPNGPCTECSLHRKTPSLKESGELLQKRVGACGGNPQLLKVLKEEGEGDLGLTSHLGLGEGGLWRAVGVRFAPEVVGVRLALRAADARQAAGHLRV